MFYGIDTSCICIHLIYWSDNDAEKKFYDTDTRGKQLSIILLENQ